MASTVEEKTQSEIPISTINVRVTGHPLDPTNTGQIIKPGELVDFIEITPLNRSELVMYNQLLAYAWPTISERGKVHRIRKAILRGSHESNDRLNKAFDSLMSGYIRIRYKDESGKEKLLRVHLIGSNTEEKEEQGFFYWTFPPELISIIENSRIWAKLKSQVMYALSSKYSLRLYELVARRIGMHSNFEIFDIDQIRGLMGVPDKKLKRFADLNRYCLKPALAEVNRLSDFNVSMAMIKRGRTVEKLIMNWHRKNPDEKQEATKALEKITTSRSQKYGGRVELITF